MEQIPFFPGENRNIDFPLDSLLPPYQAGTVRQWLQPNIPPGSWVMDPFTSNPLFTIEAATAGYKVLSICNNPILKLMLEVLADAPTREDFQSVLSILGSVKRGEDRLEVFIQSLYLTNCPRCHRQSPASSYVWKREPLELIRKTVNCPDCGGEAQGEVETEDIEKLSLLGKSELSQAWAIQQLGDLTMDQAEIARDALEVYLPRPLYVLFTLINRAQGLNLSEQKSKLMLALLLSSCLYGTSLWQAKGGRTHPRQLSIPNEFIEFNLWQKLEEAISAWTIVTQKVDLIYYPDSPGDSGGICLYNGRLKSILPLEPALQPQGVFGSIPRPSQAFWTLSALWSGWLFGKDAVQPMHSALERQHYDWYWHTHALQPLFGQIQKTKPRHGFFIIQSEFTPGYALAVFLAAQMSGWKFKSVSFLAENDLLQIHFDQPGNSNESGARREALPDAILEMMRTAAEPLEYNQLYVTALQNKARGADFDQEISALPLDYLSNIQAELTQILSVNKDIVQYGKGTFDSPRSWGLKDFNPDQNPFSEKIEQEIVRKLQQEKVVSFPALVQRLCTQFPGTIVPSTDLIKTILVSYSVPSSPNPDEWQIRSPDTRDQRQQEVLFIRSGLISLGEKFGFQVEANSLIKWMDGQGTIQWQFNILATAQLWQMLLSQLSAPTSQHVLVIPGSRIDLISYRLKHDPRLEDAIKSWHVVKFQHVRNLLGSQDISNQSWSNLLDSDPPWWQGVEQLPLLRENSD